MSISKHYIGGVTLALRDVGICEYDNLDSVIEKVADDLAAMAQGGAPPPQEAAPDTSQAPGTGMGEQASDQEMADVGQASLSDKDIESAAKVVQVIAEMKRKSDIAQGVLPPESAGLQQAAAPGQPPLPPPPQAPQQLPPGAPVGQ